VKEGFGNNLSYPTAKASRADAFIKEASQSSC